MASGAEGYTPTDTPDPPDRSGQDDLATKDKFDRLNTIFLSVLLGSGFVLGLNRLISTSWSNGTAQVWAPSNLVELLTLVLVYMSVFASVLSVVVHAGAKPSVMLHLFVINLLIMFVYLVEFAFFTNVGLVLILTAFNYALFVAWDYARSGTGLSGGTTLSYLQTPVNIVTIGAWLQFIWIAAWYQMATALDVRFGLVVAAIIVTVGYRIVQESVAT